MDIILTGGRLIDGTGAPERRADLGIAGDRIAAMGDLSGTQAGERIDCAGLVVAPGFIDIHTHSDATLLADGRADSQVHQGVTTELIGQCGYSFAPVGDPKATARWMVGRLPGVDVTWRGFGDYLAVLGERDLGVNVGALVGHGALRGAVLGDERRDPSETEHEAMRALLTEAMEAGAFGMSTGLEYWPGLGASTAELTDLAALAAERGGMHASHVRNRDIHYDIGFTEVLSIGRVAGVRTQISHIQPKYGRPEGAMAHSLAMIDQAREAGVDVGFDIIPHEWSHTSVAAILPPWAREGGTARLLERLADPDARARMRRNPAPMWRLVLDDRWDLIFLLRARDASLIGRSVAEIAEERGTDGWDTVFDLLLAEGEACTQTLWTSRNFFEDDLEMCVARPDCGIMSDTLALCDDGPTAALIGSLAGFGWTARFLAHYVRDRGILTLEEGVRRMTSLPAERMGLTDRGLLREGAMADVAVFDPDALAFPGTIAAPKVHPPGFHHVLTNGALALRDGARAPASTGRVLRAA